CAFDDPLRDGFNRGLCRIAALTRCLSLQFPAEQLVSKKFRKILSGNLGPTCRIVCDKRRGPCLHNPSRNLLPFCPGLVQPSVAADGGTAVGVRMAKGGRVSLPRTATLNRSRPRAKCERTAPTEVPIFCAASL